MMHHPILGSVNDLLPSGTDPLKQAAGKFFLNLGLKSLKMDRREQYGDGSPEVAVWFREKLAQDQAILAASLAADKDAERARGLARRSAARVEAPRPLRGDVETAGLSGPTHLLTALVYAAEIVDHFGRDAGTSAA